MRKPKIITSEVARDWLIARDPDVVPVFDTMAQRGVMMLHDFQTLSDMVPDFCTALCARVGENPITRAEIEAELAREESIDFQDVLVALTHAIAAERA